MSIVLQLHSLNRWLIIIVAVLTVTRLCFLWIRKGNMGTNDLRLVNAFNGLLGIQMVLGLVYLVWAGIVGWSLPVFRLIHAGIMLAAITVGGLPERWHKAQSPHVVRNSLLAVIGTLVLIYIGVASLPGGWAR
jgi:hypothetical protein